MICLFTAAAAFVALISGLLSSSAAEVSTLPKRDIHDRKMADEIVTGTLRGYVATTNPTEMPTYEFPTKSPSDQDFLSVVPTTEPPFYTMLPTNPPSTAVPNDTAKPSETSNAPKPSVVTGLNTSASKSNKTSKASLVPGSTQAHPATTKPSASLISTAITSSEKHPTATPSLPRSSQKLASASHSNALCDLGTKWHPSIGFRACTNSPDYPENWATKEMEHHYFYATLQECCKFIFGATGICKFEDICGSQHLSKPPTVSLTDASRMSPSDAPRGNIIDTLSPTPSPLGNGPQSGSSPPRPSVACVCLPNEDNPTENSFEQLPSGSPSLDPSSSRFYTRLPTSLLFGDISSESTMPSRVDMKLYTLDAMDIGSNDFNNFMVTSQKETTCSKVPNETEVCKLACIVTTGLYHGNIRIRDPKTETYETECPDTKGGTISTRSFETRMLLVDNVDELGQVDAQGHY
ncbi:hypothetical protein HJC23_000662 [Cyclotella cryptica]|uniref:C3H1-type domain-containing protein n=1 Tax=Cyclotella cryptica TaxID=29204 RepID=A0ABD3Q871_9STRA